jgi:hypothetical protein
MKADNKQIIDKHITLYFAACGHNAMMPVEHNAEDSSECLHCHPELAQKSLPGFCPVCGRINGTSKAHFRTKLTSL